LKQLADIISLVEKTPVVCLSDTRSFEVRHSKKTGLLTCCCC
jgi:hypothetical protein